MGSVADSVVAKIRIIIDNTNFLARKIRQKWILLWYLCLIMLNLSIKSRFFSQTMFFSMQKMLSLHGLYPHRKPQWAEAGQTYIHIRRNCTLWFWQCKNFANSQLLVKNKATGTSHGVYYIQSSLALDDSIVRCQECFLYTYTGGSSSSSQRQNTTHSRTQPTKHTCSLCNGQRRIVKDTYPSLYGQSDYQVKCNECGGYFMRSTGHTHITCPQCHGKGYFTTE